MNEEIANESWIKVERIKAGMSQRELAERLATSTGKDWDQSKVSRLESRAEDAPAWVIRAVAEVFGMNDPLPGVPGRTRPGGLIAKDALTPLRLKLEDYADQVNSLDMGEFETDEFGEIAEFRDELAALVRELGRTPRLAVMGAFDAGKSTLVNTLLGRDEMPTAYSPTTKLVTYVRHSSRRPSWLDENVEVLVLKQGFDPELWQDASNCQENLVAQGPMGLLHEYGSHRGGREENESWCALVFTDADVLQSCTLIDLPGTENNTTDTEKALAPVVCYDIALFASPAISFLDEGTLTRLGAAVDALPVLQTSGNTLGPLCNLFVIATHAHHGITDDQLDEDILYEGCERAWRLLEESAMRERGEMTGQHINKDHLRSRMFGFYRESDQRRTPLFEDLQRLLEVEMAQVFEERADREMKRFRKDATKRLKKRARFLRQLADNREVARTAYGELLSREPERKRSRKNARKAVRQAIKKNRAESLIETRKIIRRLTDEDRIARLLEKKFKGMKDAKKNAAPMIAERIRADVKKKLVRRSEKVSKSVDGYLGEFDWASPRAPGKVKEVNMPFDPRGAFAGGLVGLTGVGALSLWASTLGNLGSYIIVAKSVSLVSGLGIATGGTAVWTAAMAAIGGPITVAIGIVALSTLLGIAIFGRSTWEEEMAEELAKSFKKAKFQKKYRKLIKNYWDQTQEAFDAGSKSAEQEWKKALKRTESEVNEPTERLSGQATEIEEYRDRFGEILWQPSDGQ